MRFNVALGSAGVPPVLAVGVDADATEPLLAGIVLCCFCGELAADVGAFWGELIEDAGCGGGGFVTDGGALE